MYGHSGSPIFNDKKEVVGYVVGFTFENEKFHFLCRSFPVGMKDLIKKINCLSAEEYEKEFYKIKEVKEKDKDEEKKKQI